MFIGSHRVFTKNERMITEDDQHFVFVRPKAIVPSTCSTWASETVQLRHEQPACFQTHSDLTAETQMALACLRDTLYQYQDMTVDSDLQNVSEGQGINSIKLYFNK